MTNSEQYRSRLEEILATIHKDLDSIAVQDQTSGDWSIKPDINMSETDENTEADAFEETDERQATLALLETTYQDTLGALEKIKTNNYGQCEICGSEIETARLDFLPTARTCTEHREEEETLSL